MKQPQVYSQNEESAINLSVFSGLAGFYGIFMDYKHRELQTAKRVFPAKAGIHLESHPELACPERSRRVFPNKVIARSEATWQSH